MTSNLTPTSDLRIVFNYFVCLFVSISSIFPQLFILRNFNSRVEINEIQLKDNKQRLYIQSLPSQGSGRLSSGRQKRESFVMGKKGRLQVYLDWGLLVWGSGTQSIWKQGVLWGWLGVHIWFSLVGPKLEARTNISKAVSY